MQRSPERQYAAGGPAHSRARPRRRGPAPHVRWLVALGAASTLIGVGLVIGLGGHPASRAAPQAGTPPSGIVGANNPINVSQPGYGGWPIKSEGNGYNLYSYPSPQAGIQALVAYLTPTGYPQILAALKSGAGLSSPSLGGELSEYSGGGYSTIPDAWGASQGTPQT